ncbi:MAG TPA: phosphoribosylanthranilate isomerase [Candidatus Sulfotelmatobacter sp.]|nr:phosphoribosylanthranilate isomerase [Candidatus Sulfotelmatobacter sp.]
MTWVKVCGMTNVEDALAAAEAGADAVGFVFYEKSPRCVTVETARQIASRLPERVDRIGVFVNHKPQTVSDIADQAGLTAVQFHGDEYQSPQEYSVNRSAFFCLPAMEAVSRFRADGAWLKTDDFPNLAGIMLDSGSAENRGGTGKIFAWEEARSFVSALGPAHRVVVAGGLNSSNVALALEVLKPWGVDVVSGVEARPGKKDPEKVRAFVRAVREADRKGS